MADISQTAANVGIGAASTPTRRVQAGEAVTQGDPVYSSTDGKWYQCDANDTAAKARCAGIALTAAATDGYFLIAEPGTTPGQSLVNLGATLTVGEIYVLSATKGNIAPEGDLATGHYVTVLGVATTAALLDFRPIVSNAQVP